MDEAELAELQEQLAAARADVERLQSATADAEARAQTALDEASELRERLRASDEATAAASEREASLEARLDESASRVQAAAVRYREAVLRAEPGLPDELIAGVTVEEVDASLEAARAVVGRVRTQLEERAQAGRVPVGAPARSEPDASAMTPEQKIRYGLSRREG
ncbi:MAG: hypothetical protein WEC75_14780 [Dehalococcoidia bacterium]